LARLAKLAQITRLQKQLNQDAAGAKQEALKTSINLSRLAGMLSDLMNPMINNIVLVLIIMYIYALIGMQFFAAPNAAPYDLPPFNLTLIVPYGTVQNTTAEDLGTFFYAGRYLKRMNFNVFGNAFVTVFNIGTLNGWYLFMINTIRLQESEGVLWYFFSYIYLVLFLFGSTLIASVASVMDGHAKAMIRDIASANKSVVDRYAFLARRQRLRIWFKVLKKNTVEVTLHLTLSLNLAQLTRLKRVDSFQDFHPNHNI
jgi:ABC-type polysaccharide/polyol phosphate export permease